MRVSALLAGPGPDTPARFSARLLAIAWAQGAQHVPLILTHRQRSFVAPTQWPALASAAQSVFNVSPQGMALQPMARIEPPVPGKWPSVTIIIPTRDKPELIGTCLRKLARLEYAGPIEILVIDNGSTDPDALHILAEASDKGAIRVLRDDGIFNFPRLNNRAVAQSGSELLCLLNNDVEALDCDWLSRMVRHALCPGVGAVGAMLLYPDGAIQHAGVVIGMGGAAGHVQRGIDPLAAAHRHWHATTRTVSAVTAACLVVRTSHYRAVAGLDEEGFPVAFNDVDFCLKLKAAGLRNIYCAEAVLVHHESRSRGNDRDPDKIDRFHREQSKLQQRWQTQTVVDPHFSPLMLRSSEQCILGP